jgi:hypothetical protein
MIELGAWLAVVGLCDLLRAARDATSARRRGLIAGLGLLLLLFAAVALGAPPARTAALLAGWVACFLAWLLASAAALGSGTRDREGGHRAEALRALAFAGLGGGVLLGLLGSDLVDEVGGSVPSALGEVSVERVVLLLGVTLTQLATANVAVRQLLDAVGVPAATNEKQLKGGRVLGPMERVFIVGLGLGGELTAAAVVVAAKGLLRFPELQRGAPHGGPSDITEYFLIGSFASWLAALGGLGVLLLG